MSFQTVSGIKVQFGVTYINALASGNPNIPDDGEVQTELDHATADILTYTNVAGYTLAQVSASDSARRACGELARYYLCDEKVSATVQKKYDQIIAWLRDVAALKASLIPTGIPLEDENGDARFTVEPREFTRSKLSVF